MIDHVLLVRRAREQERALLGTERREGEGQALLQLVHRDLFSRRERLGTNRTREERNRARRHLVGRTQRNLGRVDHGRKGRGHGDTQLGEPPVTRALTLLGPARVRHCRPRLWLARRGIHQHSTVRRAHRGVGKEHERVRLDGPRLEGLELRRVDLERHVMSHALEVPNHGIPHRGHRPLAPVHHESHEALQMARELGIGRVAAAAERVGKRIGGGSRWVQ